MQIQANENITQIGGHQIIESHYNHVNAREARHLADVFDLQRIMRMSSIFCINRQRVHSFPGQEIKIHDKQSDARPGIVGIEQALG